MNNDLLIIIDMVNGFVKYGQISDPSINKITPNIIRKIEQSLANGGTIVSFQDTHEHNDPEFENYPPHCIKGTAECELIDELKHYEEHIATYFLKNKINGMEMPQIRKYFENNTFDKITVTGCCTDICISQFVLSLQQSFKETGKTTEIIVPKNCVATFDSPTHNADSYHNSALQAMQDADVIVQ